jgi:N-acetyl-anhydromuramyl-L-alanine amidase AmpD
VKSIWEGAVEYWEIDRLGVNPWPALPTGITVHYTADGDLERVKREMDKSKVGYHFIIDREGKIHQTAALTKSVNHAGKAMWNGQSPNRTHLSLAILSWGLLNDDKKAWNGQLVPEGVKRKGQYWDPATPQQERSLMNLLRALMADFEIRAGNICGHAECALPAGRKIDPGCTLPWTMAELRKALSS